MWHGGSVLSADFRTLVPDPITIVAFNPPLPVHAADGTTVVYVTETGTKYHADGCRYLKKSKIEKNLADAVAEGYEPCSKCKPGELTDE